MRFPIPDLFRVNGLDYGERSVTVKFDIHIEAMQLAAA